MVISSIHSIYFKCHLGWTTDDGSIISYETEEAFKNDERGEENVEPYSISEDGKELTIYTIDGSEVSMVLTKD